MQEIPGLFLARDRPAFLAVSDAAEVLRPIPGQAVSVLLAPRGAVSSSRPKSRRTP